MKCKIIEDLLPLYIDKVCSKETTELVEDHLKKCSKCAELYKTMSSEISNTHEDFNKIDDNLKEKDLLLNAKETIKFESMKKILKKVYKWVIILNLLFILIEFLIIKLGYDIEYPRFFVGSLGIKSYFILLTIFIFPTIFSIVGAFILKRIKTIKYYRAKSSFLIAALLISLLIGFLSNLVLFAIPPFESYTDSTKDYLIVSNDVQKHKGIFEFFPQEIPKDAKDVQYSYRKYMGLLETNIKISASWSLPHDSYELAKQHIQDTCTMETISYNKFKIHPNDTNGRDIFLDLNFEYDDELQVVTYMASYKES